jgi:hypothetical protein
VKALVNARMLLAEGWRDDACVVVEGDRIAAILGEAPAGAERIDLGGGTLLPGFIDVQVNGGGGRLFNDDPSVETIRVIAETPSALWHHRHAADADQRRPVGGRGRHPRGRCSDRGGRARHPRHPYRGPVPQPGPPRHP